MSEYTTPQILDMIEENAGPKGLDLSWADLRGIDLSRSTIQAELEKARKEDPETKPVWLSESGAINLIGANLRRAHLSRANLHGASLSQANLRGAQLWQADLHGVDLSEANLREANLSGADLQGASLWMADLRGTDLSWARLEGADLWRAHLQEADLRQADLRGSSFRGARLDRTQIDQESLEPAIAEELTKEYEQARDAYLRLKQNFDELGEFAASAWAYQKARQMEKECNAPWRARDIYGRAEVRDLSRARLCRFYARHTVKWVVDWIAEYLCGYGENPIRVLFWMAASLFGFATYYWSIGGVWLVEPGKGPIATASSFWHYLIYSAGAFTTTQFARFQAADDRVRLFTGMQAIWGIFLAGLLGFVVANKIRRS